MALGCTAAPKAAPCVLLLLAGHGCSDPLHRTTPLAVNMGMRNAKSRYIPPIYPCYVSGEYPICRILDPYVWVQAVSKTGQLYGGALAGSRSRMQPAICRAGKAKLEKRAPQTAACLPPRTSRVSSRQICIAHAVKRIKARMIRRQLQQLSTLKHQPPACLLPCSVLARATCRRRVQSLLSSYQIFCRDVD